MTALTIRSQPLFYPEEENFVSFLETIKPLSSQNQLHDILNTLRQGSWLEEGCRTIFLARVCRIHLPAALTLLQNCSVIDKDSINEAFKEEQESSQSSDEQGSQKLAQVALLANNIYKEALRIEKALQLYEKDYLNNLSFINSLHLACFFSSPAFKDLPKDTLLQKSHYKTPASLIIDKLGHPCILLPRNESNLIADGSYKVVHPAIRINPQTQKTRFTVQILSKKKFGESLERSFQYAQRFGTKGSGFAETFTGAKYYSWKKNELRRILIQKHFSGRDLFYFTGQSFLPRQKNLIAKNLAKNIQDLHKEDLAHRDIKIENCLVHINGKGEVSVALSDFDGVRKEDEVLSTAFYGTAMYTSPERIEKAYQKGLEKTNDMYALGIILCLFLIEVQPTWLNDLNELFKQKNRSLELRSSILTKQKEFVECLLQKNDGISDEDKIWIPLITSLLQPDPSLRLTADQCVEMISSIITNPS